jgi:hypothetical protein
VGNIRDQSWKTIGFRNDSNLAAGRVPALLDGKGYATPEPSSRRCPSVRFVVAEDGGFENVTPAAA